MDAGGPLSWNSGSCYSLINIIIVVVSDNLFKFSLNVSRILYYTLLESAVGNNCLVSKTLHAVTPKCCRQRASDLTHSQS